MATSFNSLFYPSWLGPCGLGPNGDGVVTVGGYTRQIKVDVSGYGNKVSNFMSNSQFLTFYWRFHSFNNTVTSTAGGNIGVQSMDNAPISRCCRVGGFKDETEYGGSAYTNPGQYELFKTTDSADFALWRCYNGSTSSEGNFLGWGTIYNATSDTTPQGFLEISGIANLYTGSVPTTHIKGFVLAQAMVTASGSIATTRQGTEGTFTDGAGINWVSYSWDRYISGDVTTGATVNINMTPSLSYHTF